MAEVLEAQDRIEDLLFIATHLIKILEQENKALEDGKIEVVHELLDQKSKLSRAYEIRVLGLEQSGQDLSKVDRPLLEDLQKHSDRLHELVEINKRDLSIRIDVSTLYMDMIADSVKAATPSAGTYSSNGNANIDALGSKTKSPSFAFDENL